MTKPISGTNISHVTNTTIFNLAAGHTYLVIFDVNGVEGTEAGWQFGARINGTTFVGTPSRGILATTAYTSSTGFAYITTAGATTLEIVDQSNVTTTGVVATVNILQLN